MKKKMLLASFLLATAVFGTETKYFFVRDSGFRSASNEVHYKGLTKLMTHDFKSRVQKDKCSKLVSTRKQANYIVTPYVDGISIKDNCTTSFWSGKETCVKDSELIYIEHGLSTTSKGKVVYLGNPSWTHKWTAVKKGTDLVAYARKVIKRDYAKFNLCKKR